MKIYETLDEHLKGFILKQKMFFVASAPSSPNAMVNLSPKGLDTFKIIDDRSVAYLDLTGSGNETSAHILENQRLTVMFCSFSGAPLILRLYGRGEVILPGNEQWQDLLHAFPTYPGIRQVIKLHIETVQTSCGFAVPEYDFVRQRDDLNTWAQKKGANGISKYQKNNNLISIDGKATHLSAKTDD